MTGRPAKIVGRTPVRWIFRNLRVASAFASHYGTFGSAPCFKLRSLGVSRQVDAEQPNFRIARQSAGASQSRTWGRLSPGLEAVLVAQLCDVRLESQPPGKSRFAAIGRQYAIL